jgi:hypothetical protein
VRRTWADIVAEGDTTVQLDDPPHSTEADGDRPQWKPEAEPLVQVTLEMPVGEEPTGPPESAPMEDGTGGAMREPRDGQDSPEMALEQGLRTDAPLELGMVERRDEKPPVREAVTPTARRTGTGGGGKEGEQTGGTATGPHAASPVGERGADLGRIKKQRLDRSDETLTGWKRTRVKGSRPAHGGNTRTCDSCSSIDS